jgi:hypothetical protein
MVIVMVNPEPEGECVMVMMWDTTAPVTCAVCDRQANVNFLFVCLLPQLFSVAGEDHALYVHGDQ